MRKTIIGPDVGSDLELFEGVEGVDGLPHSEAVVVDHAEYRRVYVSGTGAIDDDGNVVAPGDAAAQLQYILESIEEMLALVDGGPEDIVRVRLLAEPMSEAEYLEVCRVRAAFTPDGHEPASTMTEAESVGIEGMRLEVDVDAVVPYDGWSVSSTDR